MRKHIINILKRARGTYVSGQALCEDLGVSRTAIWKHIQQLRAEGYEIDSSSRKGYRLIHVPDLLNSYEIEPLLITTHLGHPILHYKELDSTNIEARKLAHEGATHGSVVVAEHQTTGRGRSGRGWFSAPGTSIQMSLILRPDLAPSLAASVTQVGAAAVATALQKLGLSPQIKWPNDILLSKRKVCGILTEMSCELDHIEHIIIGIGINVNTPFFPRDIRSVATSVQIEKGTPCDRKSLMAAILNTFEPLYQGFLEGHPYPAYLRICRELSILIGEEITYESPQGVTTATAIDIDSSGHLVVRHKDGSTEALLSGEVHLGTGSYREP
ncbi:MULTISPECIES: biotin--[acetyl-CoA-carboxylase] ligase [Aminobacterium]|uniref:biotin--[acetyl-CoA-carboxylase] ligase n=1 Tax=Aminobacterium TaxID=81466 RepID=UPI002579A6EC|nr:biotin--[acetyl-CoA-carboxylase] ligase [Aminobacterium sp. UBA4834]